MRGAGAVVGSVISLLKRSVEPGMTTRELDKIAFNEITRLGAKPTFKGYRGFPASICTSVNEEIVHGIPGKRVLKEGDIIKLDVGATLNGMIGDAAVSVAVGQVSQEALDLMDATRESLAARSSSLAYDFAGSWAKRGSNRPWPRPAGIRVRPLS